MVYTYYIIKVGVYTLIPLLCVQKIQPSWGSKRLKCLWNVGTHDRLERPNGTKEETEEREALIAFVMLRTRSN
jgi:hypothetical protein